jgi:hypothetical protein
MTPDREPVGQAINSIIDALDAIACMTLVESTYEEVAAEEEDLKWIIKRTELILKLIKSRRAQIRAVQ